MCCYSTPQGLQDVSTYPALFAELIASGLWELDDLKKLAGLNLIRVMKAVEKVHFKCLIYLQSISFGNLNTDGRHTK